MKTFNINTGNSDWLTPPWLVRALGPFDLDPCASTGARWRTAAELYTKEDDGLSRPWRGRVWLNPPYGRETWRWVARLAEHKFGLALIFARTDTEGFHKYVWGRALAVFFFRGRLSFHFPDGTKGDAAPAPSCLVAYSPPDAEILADAGLNGKFVKL